MRVPCGVGAVSQAPPPLYQSAGGPFSFLDTQPRLMCGNQMSTCSSLSALDHANSKYTKGYATSRIVCTTCRHEFILLEGAGPLQKGERSVFHSSLSVHVTEFHHQICKHRLHGRAKHLPQPQNKKGCILQCYVSVDHQPSSPPQKSSPSGCQAFISPDCGPHRSKVPSSCSQRKLLNQLLPQL